METATVYNCRYAKPLRRSKRQEWSVYIVLEVEGYIGRVLSRKSKKRREMGNRPVPIMHEYLYLDVTGMWEEDNIVYITAVEKGVSKLHSHDKRKIKEVWVREYKREGVQ